MAKAKQRPISTAQVSRQINNSSREPYSSISMMLFGSRTISHEVISLSATIKFSFLQKLQKLQKLKKFSQQVPDGTLNFLFDQRAGLEDRMGLRQPGAGSLEDHPDGDAL